MATAIKKSRGRAVSRLPGQAPEVRAQASMEFHIFEDNAGDYHWTIVAEDGATLARSEGFGSYDAAEQAAGHIREGAASAVFERSALGAPLGDLSARRDLPSADSDAERWLDEGGSFSSDPMAR